MAQRTSDREVGIWTPLGVDGGLIFERERVWYAPVAGLAVARADAFSAPARCPLPDRDCLTGRAPTRVQLGQLSLVMRDS